MNPNPNIEDDGQARYFADPKPFRLSRISASFQPAGSDKFIDLGEVRDVKITNTITMGGNTFTNTYEPGNPASMEAATNRLARIALNPSPSNIKIIAAEARRARRNAKRVADAEALAATASAAATPWPNPPYVAGQTFFDGRIDWTFYERRQEWIGVTRTYQARRNAKRAREAAKVGA
jgi:hypothetical protein